MALHWMDAEDSFGIKGEDADYTDQLMGASTAAKAVIAAGDQPILVLPPGLIRLSQTLPIYGNGGGAPWVIGSGGRTFNCPGTQIAWYGAAGATMVQTEAFNCGLLKGFSLNPRSIAGRGLVISASTFADPTKEAACDGFLIEDFRVDGVQPGVAGNGCIAFGSDPAISGGEFECGDGVLRNFQVVGEDPGASGFSWAAMKAFGVKTLSAGNCQDFALYDASFNTCGTAMDWGNASGYFRASRVGAADCGVFANVGDGQFGVQGFNVVCGDVADFRLLKGTAQQACSAYLSDGQAFWGTPAGTPGILLTFGGNLSMKRLSLGYNQAGATGWYLPFIMQHAALTQGQFGSFISEQNTYFGCGTAQRPYIPLYDVNGNDLCPVAGAYGSTLPLSVRSWNDTGIPQNGAPMRFQSFDSTPIRFPHMTS